MKGLWKKDWYLMKELKKTLILMMLLVLLMLFGRTANLIFALNYMTILSAMMVVNTFALDEQKSGNAFLFTLPFSRRTYVAEKYLFGVMLGVIGWGLTIGAGIAVTLIKGGEIRWGEFGMQGVTALGLLAVMLCVMIPIQIKFGAEKGRVVMIAAVLSVSFAGAGLMSILQGEPETQIAQQIRQIAGQRWIGAAMGAALVCLVVLSVACSIRMIEKKEY